MYPRGEQAMYIRSVATKPPAVNLLSTWHNGRYDVPRLKRLSCINKCIGESNQDGLKSVIYFIPKQQENVQFLKLF